MALVDRYSCEDAFRRLDDYMDRQLTQREIAKVEEHLRYCAVCAAEYRFEASVLNCVREKVQRLKAPPELLAKVLAGLEGPVVRESD
jgi:anti-sigma factor (TIGR02949 family)